jgi:hypothetical protein
VTNGELSNELKIKDDKSLIFNIKKEIKEKTG